LAKIALKSDHRIVPWMVDCLTKVWTWLGTFFRKNIEGYFSLIQLVYKVAQE
jgi:hypothetical protein